VARSGALLFAANPPRLVGDALGEERGDFVGGEAEAFLRGRKCRDKGGMVFAEVLRRVEEVAEVGLVEPITERGPFAALGEGDDELQLGERARRNFNVDELVHGLYVGRRLVEAGEREKSKHGRIPYRGISSSVHHNSTLFPFFLGESQDEIICVCKVVCISKVINIKRRPRPIFKDSDIAYRFGEPNNDIAIKMAYLVMIL